MTSPSGGAILAIILAGLLLCVSAFVSASEIAYFSLSSEELHEFDNDESTTNALVKKLLSRPEYLLATILISNNLVNVAIVILCNFFFSDILHFQCECNSAQNRTAPTPDHVSRRILLYIPVRPVFFQVLLLRD